MDRAGPEKLHLWRHFHSFGQETRRPGEVRTFIVIVITATMMVVEIMAGILFGSMALLADGMHMASHAAALTINALAYLYARRHAQDARYSFGTGKVNALGGFTGAILLVVFALLMGWESATRFYHPVQIAFNQAIFVAFLGLVVNGISVGILKHEDGDGMESRNALDRPPGKEGNHGHSRGGDHNLRAAYLHVLADALTSLLAIFALLTAKYFGWVWMDPLMGIVGAALVSRWSLQLLRITSGILLDKQGPQEIRNRIQASIEGQNDALVADLHLWAIGPNIYAAEISIVAKTPRTPPQYKAMIPKDLGLVHVSVEVHEA
jgi:cation diffusion facilitator family transporter